MKEIFSIFGPILGQLGKDYTENIKLDLKSPNVNLYKNLFFRSFFKSFDFYLSMEDHSGRYDHSKKIKCTNLKKKITNDKEKLIPIINDLNKFFTKISILSYRQYISKKILNGFDIKSNKDDEEILENCLFYFQEACINFCNEDQFRKLLLGTQFWEKNEHYFKGVSRYYHFLNQSNSNLKDIENIGHDKYTLKDVYTERSKTENKIAEKIRDFLSGDTFDGKPIMIKGEAGIGKSSIIWKLFKMMNKDIVDCFLLKSLQLGTDQDIIDVELAIQYRNNLNKKNIIFIDTADLLLHNGATLNLFQKALRVWQERGALTIFSTRIREADKLRDSDFYSTHLNRYTETELALAIKNYIRCYYDNSIIGYTDLQKESQRIINAVANGHPIKEVCENPLTLKMLFQVYQGKDVSLEINIYQLYKTYWQNKVVIDNRNERFDIEINLSEPAFLISLTMWFLGTPIITSQEWEKFTNTFTKFRNKFSDRELIDRGVIKKSNIHQTIYNIEFFHQTFFEHTSARAFLQYGSVKSLKWLEKQIINDPANLFVIPIFEQLLLLGEENYEYDKQTQKSLKKLLSSNNYNLQVSGIYVYIHLQNTVKSLYNEITNLFSSNKNNKELKREFLNMCGNIAEHRTSEIFNILNIFWKNINWQNPKENWNELCNLLELLKRYSGRKPLLTKEFYIKNNIIETILKINLSEVNIRSLSTHIIFDTLSILLKTDSDWSISQINKFLNDQLTVLQINHLINLFRDINIINREKYNNFIQNYLLERFSNLSDLPVKIKESYSDYISDDFNHRKLNIIKIQNNIHESPKLLKDTIYNATAKYLIKSDQNLWQDVVDLFETINDEREKWSWSNIVFQSIFNYLSVKDDLNDKKNKTIIFTKRIKELIYLECQSFQNNGKAKHLFGTHPLKYYAVALEKSFFEGIFVANLFNYEILKKEKFWLTKSVFLPFLYKAYISGHKGAKKTILFLLENPQKTKQREIKNVINSIVDWLIKNQKIDLLIVKLLIASRNHNIDAYKKLGSVIHSASKKESLKLKPVIDELLVLLQKMLHSRKGVQLAAAVQIQTGLINNHIISPPKELEAIEIYKAMPNDVAQKNALDIIEKSVIPNSKNSITATLDFLHLKYNEGKYIDKIRNIIIDVYIQSIPYHFHLTDALLDFMMIKVNAGELGKLSKIFYDLTEPQTNNSFSFLLKLINKINQVFENNPNINITERQIRDGMGKLKWQIERLIKTIDITKCKTIIELIDSNKINDNISIFLIRGILLDHSKQKELESKLKDLFNNPKITDNLKSTMLGYLQRNRQHGSSIKWEGLLDKLKYLRID